MEDFQQSNPLYIDISERASRYLGVGVAGLGVVVLLGWMLDVSALKSLFPELGTMKFNTALLFLLAGVSLVTLTPRIRQICDVVVITIAVLTLIEYGFGWNPGIDEWLVRDVATATEGGDYPGRMSIVTAMNFVLVGGGLLLLRQKSILPQVLALLSGFLAMVALVSYSFDVQIMSRVAPYSSMALHTAFAFVMLSLGILLANVDSRLMRPVISNGADGILTRKLLPITVLGLLLLGWLQFQGHNLGLYDAEFGSALMTILNFLLLVVAIRWSASHLHQTDLQRLKAEKTLQQAHNELEERVRKQTAEVRDLYDNAPCGYHSLDKDGIFVQINATELRWLGYAHNEVVGKKKFSDVITAESLKVFQQNFPTFKERGWVNDLEFEMVRKDGTTFNVLLNATAIKDTAGNYVSSRSTLFDITERKRTEAMFRGLLESAPDAMVIVNTAGQIMLVNAQTQQLLGYEADELIGQSIEMLIPHSFRQRHPEHRTHYFTDPQPRPMGAGMELFALCKVGREVPVEISLSPLETEEGMLVISTIRDITERKRIEAVLREQHAELEQRVAERTEQLSFLAEASQLLVESFDYHTRLKQLAQLAVPRIADWCAVDIVEEDGEAHRLAVVHTDPAKVEQAYELQRRYPSDPNAPTGMYNVLRTGQSEFYPEISEEMLLAAVRDEEQRRLVRELGLRSAMTVPLAAHGQVFGVMTLVMAESNRRYTASDLALAEDLAHRAGLLIDHARLYARAQQLNLELEQRVVERTAGLAAINKELESFSYSVSHDLRAPLRALDGFSQALLEDYEDVVDEEGKEYLTLIRTESQRMGQLIDDLLNLSRLTRSNLNYEVVNLSEIVHDIARELRAQDPKRRVEFIIEDNLLACADPHLMRVALQNLVGNAWKYSSKQPTARIEFGSTLEQGETLYFVRDNGVGFDMNYVHKLFGAFQRLHSVTEFEGTGIGLATVQRIIHQHGGSVRAQGAINEGATFSFTLKQENCG